MKTMRIARISLLAAFLTTILPTGCKKEPKFDPVDPKPAENAGGLLVDPNAAPIPQDITFVGGGNLPSMVDLSYLLPPVGNQMNYGTCVAWSTAYYIRTAMQAVRENLSSDQLKDPFRQFSPKDLFLAVPSEYKGENCDGLVYNQAFNQLIERGVATMATAPYENLGDCSIAPDASWTAEANYYRIDSYRELSADVDLMKAKLAEDHPFMVVTYPTRSFVEWKGSGVMHTADVLTGPALYGHAITVVGYDDAKNAFRIVNSWGEDWGDNGFAWIDYDLMVHPDFCPGGAVLYDKPAVTPPVTTLSNLSATLLHDVDDPNTNDATYRTIEFSVANTGQEPIPASADWNIYYLYYDAFDANRYGVLLDMYVSNDYGNAGETGYYNNGAGSSYNQWVNTDMPGNGLLSEQMFGPGYSSILWPYQMPSVNGYYYLVMIVDPFNAMEESNESDNYYFITAGDGGPIWFENGVGSGLQSGEVDDRSDAATTNCRTPVDTNHTNAYRPDEIKGFIKRLKAEGKLPRPEKNGKGKPVAVAR